MTDKKTELDGFADVPLAERRRAEKYGMPIEYADRIVQRHFGLAEDEAALAGGRLAADIEMSKALADKS